MNKIKSHELEPIKEIIDVHIGFIERLIEKGQDSEDENKKEGSSES
tara:strand:- start:247 stop:384 length:138 start_codon:yes stop_codon:yes gene_type:complete